MINVTHPKVIRLQETLAVGDLIMEYFKILLSGWEFLGGDSYGRSGGLLIEWHMTDFLCTNSWGFSLGLDANIFLNEFGMSFSLLNVHGPYH